MVQIANLTVKTVDTTLFIKDLLDVRKDELGVVDVFYGSQQLIPNYPSITVESMPKDRELVGTHRFAVTVRSGIMILHAQLQSTTVTKQECEELAERVEDIISEDHTFSGLVVFGYVTGIVPGVTRIGEGLVRASRIIWEGISREEF